jgi:hypothetical protein
VSDAAKCRRGHRMGDAYDAVMSPDFCSTSPVIRRSPSEEISTRTPPGPSISSSSSYLACGGAQGKLSAVVVSDRRLCSSLCVFVCVCACVCVCVCVCENMCVCARVTYSGPSMRSSTPASCSIPLKVSSPSQLSGCHTWTDGCAGEDRP